MISLNITVLLIFQLMVPYMTCLFFKVPVNPKDNKCLHQCMCSSDSSVDHKIVCSISTQDDWEVTCRQFSETIFPASDTHLKLVGNINTISAKLACHPELQSLDLSKTNLELTNNLFRNLSSLSFLNISSNGIRNLPTDIFFNLQQLYELDLSHNSISVLEPKLFQGLSALEILHFDFNKLSVLSPNLFFYTPKLKNLGLEYNQIQEVSPLSIQYFPFLKSLNLRGNILKTVMLSSVDVDFWKNLLSLDLSENPLECSCNLRDLFTLLPNLSQALVNSHATTCMTPKKLKGQSILSIASSEMLCTAPKNVISYPSSYKDILGTSSITLQCEAEGFPKPTILWVTPWQDKFSSDSVMLLSQFTQNLHLKPYEKFLTHREYQEPNVFMVSSVHLTPNNDLVINKIRGSMSGNYTCWAFNFAGNTSVEITLQVFSAVKTVYIQSLFLGGYCASGFLIFGFMIGLIRMIVVWLRHKMYFIVPMFSKPPSTKQTDPCTCSSSDVSLPKSGSDDSLPDLSLLVPVTELEISGISDRYDDPTGDNPGSWLSYGIFDSFEEAKGRLRDGVGRKMERMRKNVQSIKESGSVYVHNIVESSSTAASKMKAGVVLGVETVKYHVQSFKELCGTGDMGAQTISMVSVETDVDTNKQKEIVRQMTFV